MADLITALHQDVKNWGTSFPSNVPRNGYMFFKLPVNPVSPTGNDYKLYYGLTATNTWIPLAGGTGGGVVGVQTLEGLVGNIELIAGNGINVTNAGNDITLSVPDLVKKLNGLEDNINLIGVNGLTVTPTGNNINLSAPNSVRSFNGLINDVLLEGAGSVIISVSGNTITVTGTGGGGGGSSGFTATATGSGVTAGRVVYITTTDRIVAHADKTNLSSQNKVVGFATNTAIGGADVDIQSSGELGLTTGLTAGTILFLHTNGQITTSPPSPGTGAYSQIVGVVKDSDHIIILIGGAVEEHHLPLNDLLTTTGDLLYRSSGGLTRLGIGAPGQILTSSSGVPTWSNPTGVTSLNSLTGNLNLLAGDNVTLELDGSNIILNAQVADILVKATFDGPDDATGLPVPEISPGGNTWVQYNNADFGVIDNQAYPVTVHGSDNYQMALIDSTIASGLIECTFTVQEHDMRIFFRCTNENNGWLLQAFGTSDWRLYTLSGGGYGFVGGNSTYPPADGDTIQITLNNDRIIIAISENIVFDLTSSHNISGTKHGIGIGYSGPTSARYDDFYVKSLKGVTSLNGLVDGVTIAGGNGTTVSVSGSTITVSESNDVTQLNSMQGNVNIAAGTGISVNNSAPNITINNTGVTSIEGLTGAVNVVDGIGITATASGSNLTIAGTTVNNLQGDVQLAAGSGMTITPSGNTLTLSSSGGASGVSSVNTLTGALTVTGAGGITISATSSTNIEISGTGSTASNVEISVVNGTIATMSRQWVNLYLDSGNLRMRPAQWNLSTGEFRKAHGYLTQNGVIAGDSGTVLLVGLLTGLSGLTAGRDYYGDPSTPGGHTLLLDGSRSTVEQWLMISKSTTEAWIRPDPKTLHSQSALTSFLPSDLPNLVGWYKADSLLTGLSNNDPVASWADNSGANNDVTQGTSGYQPTFKTNYWNGLPVVQFDGIDDRLDDSSFSITSTTGGWTCFVVASIQSSTTASFPRIIAFSSTGSPDYVSGISLNVSNNTGDYAGLRILMVESVRKGGVSVDIPNQVFWDELFLCVLRFTPVSGGTPASGNLTSEFLMRLNGENLRLLKTNNNTLNTEYFRLGGYHGGSGAYSDPYGGAMGEVVVYNADLTNNQIRLVEYYLMKRWALRWNFR